MLKAVSKGNKIPNEFNVVIEIPANSEPIKYEVDKETGAMFVDRFMLTSMRYPCDYGYIPETLSLDGDPMDVLVVSPLPLISGSVIQVRPIGLLQMTDESGIDAKILAVPINKLTPLYKDINCPEDLHQLTLDRIAHFFEHYKDLETDKWVKINGWKGSAAAIKEITDSCQRYQDSIKSSN